jgi:predicted PurR-regulated permease PerM
MAGVKSNPVFLLVVGIAAMFIVVWGIRSTAVIINPILLATVITIVVLPLPAKLTERGLPGWASFALTLVAVIGGMAIVVFIVFVSITQIPADLSGQAGSHAGGQSIVDSLSGFLSSEQVEQFSQVIISGAVNSLLMIGMVLLIFIFMLSAAISLPNTNRLSLRADSPALKSIAQLTEEVRRYMSIMTGINLLVGLGDTILLWILGVPYAVLWGILAWVLGYIPTVGFWIALIPPLLIAWQQQGIQTAAIVFVGYVLINGSVQDFIQPRLMGQGLGISPLVVFISLFVWGWLLGGTGAILAVPLTMIIMAILANFANTRWIAILMSVPTDDKKDDHQNALDRLRTMWQRTKNAMLGGDESQNEADNNIITIEPEITQKGDVERE